MVGFNGPALALFPKSTWAAYLSDQMKAIESNLAMAARPPRLQGPGPHHLMRQHRYPHRHDGCRMGP